MIAMDLKAIWEMSDYTFHAETLHGKVVGGFLISVGVIFLLVPETVVSGGMLIGFAMLALGASVFLMIVWTASDKRARMIVNDEGVWHREWGLNVIPWNEISRVYMQGLRWDIKICVELKNPERFLATMSPADRSRLRSNPLIKLPELRLPPSALDATVDELLTALRSGLQS